VRSPFVEAGLTKNELRELARGMNLDFWNKPSAACLSSRIPYGHAITPEKLRRIETFEEALRTLGLKQVRVRFHDDIARIEVAKEEMAKAFEVREAIVSAGKAAGFTFIALDLAGYRSGSLNELLSSRRGQWGRLRRLFNVSPDFPQTGLFALELAKVVETRTPHLAAADDFDLLDTGWMQGENTFHADSARALSNAKSRSNTAAGLTDHNALKNLDAFLLAFENSVKYPNGISNSKWREYFFLFGFDGINLWNESGHCDISRD
jgi:hypothetical protein